MLFRFLARRSFRRALSAASIAVSFAMLLALGSVALGLYDLSRERLETSPGDLVVSSQGLNPTIPDSHIIARELGKDPNFTAAMPILTVLGRIGIPDAPGPAGGPTKDARYEGPMEVLSIGMVGIVPDMTLAFMDDDSLSIRSEVLEFEGWFSRGDDPFHASNYTYDWTGEVLLDDNIMERYSIQPGSLVYLIGNDGSVRSSFRVTGSVKTSLTGGGITSGIVTGAAIFQMGELQYATEHHIESDPTGERYDLGTGIYLKVSGPNRDPGSIRVLSGYLSEKVPGHRVSTTEGRLYRLEEEVLVLQVFALSVGSASLLVGVLFLSTIMLIEQEERRSEIAVMRAIGVPLGSVVREIVGQSMLVAMAGAMVGTLPGILGAGWLDTFLRDMYGLDITFVRMDPIVFIGCSVFLAVNVLLFSLIPSLSLVRMDIRSSLGRMLPR